MKIIEFYNESCGACKLIKPVLLKVKEDFDCELEFIDIDTNPQYIQQYDITTLPYVRITSDNHLIEFTGYRPYAALQKMLHKIKSE